MNGWLRSHIVHGEKQRRFLRVFELSDLAHEDAKFSALSKIVKLYEDLSRFPKTTGGSSETELKLLAVAPDELVLRTGRYYRDAHRKGAKRIAD